MRMVIIPTAEIISEFRHMDPVFCFYEDGVRGVVKDMVLRNTAGDDTGVVEQTLLNDIVAMYEHSLHVRYLENTLRITDPVIYIELFVAGLQETVSELLRQLFASVLSDHQWDSSEWGWIGNDLIVRMTPFEKQAHTPAGARLLTRAC